MNTRSHSLEIENDMKTEFKDWFETEVERFTKFWNEFVLNSLRNSAATIPTYFVRYEDLILKPEQILIDIIQFMLDVPSIEGTVVEA